jgi:hypothetical protein
MINKKNALLTILEIELNDLSEDITLLVEQYRERHRKDEIADYVFLENLAIMQNELFGVTGFAQDVAEIDVDDFEGLDAMIDYLKTELEQRVKERGIARAVIYLISRKIDKVRGYVEGCAGAGSILSQRAEHMYHEA